MARTIKSYVKEFLVNPSKLKKDKIGQGLYSTVFSVKGNNNLAIKISRSLFDGWPIYAAWCMEKDRGPYALKVYALKFDNNKYYALMERAKISIQDVKDRRTLANFCADFGNPTYFSKKDIRDLEIEFPKLKQFLFKCYDFGLKKSLYTDLHDENIMLRKNNTLVIVDPFSEIDIDDENLSTFEYIKANTKSKKVSTIVYTKSFHRELTKGKMI